MVPYTAVTNIAGHRVVVLAPHPDDEVFGCGGAIMRHVAAGDALLVIVVSDGEYRAEPEQMAAYANTRREESRQAALKLGYGCPTFWGFPDRGIEYGEQLLHHIEGAVNDFNADLVYAPSIFEMHPDHRALGMAAVEAVRRHSGELRIALYEVGVPMLRPNTLLDISDIAQRKQEAMACFASQLLEQAYDEHIAALNRFRTYTLGQQISAAEAFLVTTGSALKSDVLGLYESEYAKQRGLGFPLVSADLPLVSVLLRSMDRSTLSFALDSVALQTYPHIEVVVVNATGNNHSPIGDWCGRFPMRVVGSGNRLQRSQAANVAIANAKGKYLIFLDDDDWFEAQHVDTLVKKIISDTKFKAVYANVQVVSAHGDYLDHIFNTEFDPLKLMADNLIPIHAILFDKCLIEAGCLFDETLDVYEDWDFWLQIARLTDFSHLNRVGAYYVVVGNSQVGLNGTAEVKSIARRRIFDKWKTAWTGLQIDELLAHKDSLVLTKNGELHAQKCKFDQTIRENSDTLNSTIQQFQEQLQKQLIEQRQEQEQLKARLLDQASVTESVNRNLAESESRSIELQKHLDAVHASTSWRATQPLRWAVTRLRNAKHVVRMAGRSIQLNGGGMQGTWRLLLKVFATVRQDGGRGLLNKIRSRARKASIANAGFNAVYSVSTFHQTVQHDVMPHEQSVAIIVCIHNALIDVKRCLDSVICHTLPPYDLVLVDDGSDADTEAFLQKFAEAQGAHLIRNSVAKGYTLAANQGLRKTSADYSVLLNSDTIVSTQWLDRMIMCAESDTRIGVVGPLSNTASWQSVPDILVNGDWADNPLPKGMSIETMATLIAGKAHRKYPRIPLLNGFCLLIKRALIDDIGLFDEESFAQGYGEENDYCLRARSSGWSLALAEDVYVYHAQSKSYSHERRQLLSEKAGAILEQKHGQNVIGQSVEFCRFDRVLIGLRAHVRSVLASHLLRNQAKDQWEGKRVLFFLPTADAGGGSNVVISEALALISFGVDVRLVNYTSNLNTFERSYPAIQVPRVYVDNDLELVDAIRGYDAIVGTVNTTIQSLARIMRSMPTPPTAGYYIQDYEPWFYKENSEEYQNALESYGLIPDMVLFTKTQWNQRTLKDKTGMVCTVIGPSFNSTLFRPLPRQESSWPERPLRIVAMIRPFTPRRAPKLTMEVLRNVYRKYGERIEIVLFGEETTHPDFIALPQDFKWRNLGKQSPEQLAIVMNESDIFVDFSEYQAMGLTAMEAMACGVAVIVPELGGANSFAEHTSNALFVDSQNADACVSALSRLIEDDHLRVNMQRQAIQAVSQFTPEVAAYNLMQAMFPSNSLRERA